MSRDLLTVVDAHDRPVDEAPRDQCHADGLRHRAVQVHVYDPEGRLFVHRRSASKALYPGLWTASAAGHVDAGESYDAAARRELQEELRLEGRLRRELKFFFEDAQGGLVEREFTTLYTLVTDATPSPDPGEIAEGRWLVPEAVDAWLAEDPEAFAPSFREAFHRYLWKC